MNPIAVFRNDAEAPPGYLADALDRANGPWRVVRLDDDESLPALGDVTGVVVLGGLMGAYDQEEYPYLAHEKEFLAHAVDADVPVLGICLGAQLLADALGGRAYLAAVPEATYAPVVLSEEGAADPITSTLADRHVLRLHQDTWDLPPGAVSLAGGGGFEQAFRIGSGLGIPPHPEAGPESVASWLSHPGTRDLVRDAGADPDELLATAESWRGEGEQTAQALFDAWLNESRVGGRES